MSNISLLSIGCTGQELVDKINEIIAAINGMSNVTSYNDLTNKPIINGVELKGTKTTFSLNIAVADAVDFSTSITEVLATKEEVEDAQESATEAATAAVEQQIAGKMDKNPSALSEATMTDGGAYVCVFGDGELKKIKLETLTNNVAFSIGQASTIDKVVQSSGKLLTITGTQDGTRTTFYISGGYELGTSFLYFNGQLLTRGTDYIENSTTSIVMLTHIPVSTDIMRFVAVPLQIPT